MHMLYSSYFQYYREANDINSNQGKYNFSVQSFPQKLDLLISHYRIIYCYIHLPFRNSRILYASANDVWIQPNLVPALLVSDVEIAITTMGVMYWIKVLRLVSCFQQIPLIQTQISFVIHANQRCHQKGYFKQLVVANFSLYSKTNLSL